MALYRYRALDGRGEPNTGQMEAASAEEVIAQLQAQGQLPIDARPAGDTGALPWAWRGARRRGMAADVRLQFTQQLATLLAAGQPLDRALAILTELPGADARLMDELGEVVRGGGALSVALQRHPAIFPRLYVSMVHAGEASGNLAPALQRLADYLQRSAELRARVVNALVYPLILLGVVALAMVFLLGYVVPQFAQMYASLDVELPWFTRATLALGLGVRDWWWLLALLPLPLVLWLGRRWHDPAFRLALDGWLLRRRGIGPLLAKLETARLARTLGTLLHSGVPLLGALAISSQVLGNRVLSAALAAAAEEVKGGRALAGALARSGLFPALAVQMIQVGEESGALDPMLLRTADSFEAESARTIDRLLAALVPALTLLLAVVVGVVIITVLVPLYDLTNAIG